MEELNIRQAGMSDVPALAQLKCTYVHALYKGFISQDVLNRSTPAFHEAMLTAWLESGQYRIALIERDGKPANYIMYGSNPDEPFDGLIYEGVCDPHTTSEEKRRLVEHCLQELRGMGHAKAYLWILVDNFRVRYLFESLGFRPDGARETREMFGQELRIARYQYKL